MTVKAICEGNFSASLENECNTIYGRTEAYIDDYNLCEASVDLVLRIANIHPEPNPLDPTSYPSPGDTFTLTNAGLDPMKLFYKKKDSNGNFIMSSVPDIDVFVYTGEEDVVMGNKTDYIFRHELTGLPIGNYFECLNDPVELKKWSMSVHADIQPFPLYNIDDDKFFPCYIFEEKCCGNDLGCEPGDTNYDKEQVCFCYCAYDGPRIINQNDENFQNVENLDTEAPTANQNLESSKLASISPNPFSNELNFEFSTSLNSEYSVEIYNMQGKLMMERKSLSTKVRSGINTSNLETGFYFCKLNINGKTEVHKLTKTF